MKYLIIKLCFLLFISLVVIVAFGAGYQMSGMFGGSVMVLFALPIAIPLMITVWDN